MKLRKKGSNEGIDIPDAVAVPGRFGIPFTDEEIGEMMQRGQSVILNDLGLPYSDTDDDGYDSVREREFLERNGQL